MQSVRLVQILNVSYYVARYLIPVVAVISNTGTGHLAAISVGAFMKAWCLVVVEIQLVEAVRLAPDIGDQRLAVHYIMLAAALEASVSSEAEGRIYPLYIHFFP